MIKRWFFKICKRAWIGLLLPGRTPAEEGSLFNLKEDIGENQGCIGAVS